MTNLVKRFGDTEVIPRFDLEIHDHEFIVFVGPSGCGKSTLLRIIAGLEPIDAGDLHIGERRVNDVPAARRDIAMVFQDYALYPHMTVYQNMAFALEMRNLPRMEIERRVQRAAGMLHIEALLERRPKALSGGQRQRVAMGRAIVRDPAAFLFDEPLSNLDAKLRAEVRAEIKALSQSLRNTMVFVTHDQVEAMTMAERIVVLKGGVIQQLGVPEEVYERPANQFVASFIGSPTMNFFPVAIEEKNVRLGDGTRLGLDPERLAAARRGGSTAILGVRPEHFLRTPDGEGEIEATLSLVEPLGSDTFVHFDCGNVATLARIAPDLRARPSDRMSFTIAPAKAHLFHAETGKSLSAA